MGPGLEWVNAAYSGRPQITMPYGLGDTTDLTNTLSVLKLAGFARSWSRTTRSASPTAAAHASQPSPNAPATTTRATRNCSSWPHAP